MDALIDALLDWIAQNSAYETRAISHPTVIALTPEDLTREMYTGVAHLIPEDDVDERINAIYAHEEETIYILEAARIEGADEFDRPDENPLWREILLHELVHHVQWQTATPDPLPNRAFWARIHARC